MQVPGGHRHQGGAQRAHHRKIGMPVSGQFPLDGLLPLQQCPRVIFLVHLVGQVLELPGVVLVKRQQLADKEELLLRISKLGIVGNQPFIVLPQVGSRVVVPADALMHPQAIFQSLLGRFQFPVAFRKVGPGRDLVRMVPRFGQLRFGRMQQRQGRPVRLLHAMVDAFRVLEIRHHRRDSIRRCQFHSQDIVVRGKVMPSRLRMAEPDGVERLEVGHVVLLPEIRKALRQQGNRLIIVPQEILRQGNRVLYLVDQVGVVRGGDVLVGGKVRMQRFRVGLVVIVGGADREVGTAYRGIVTAGVRLFQQAVGIDHPEPAFRQVHHRPVRIRLLLGLPFPGRLAEPVLGNMACLDGIAAVFDHHPVEFRVIHRGEAVRFGWVPGIGNC